MTTVIIADRPDCDCANCGREIVHGDRIVETSEEQFAHEKCPSDVLDSASAEDIRDLAAMKEKAKATTAAKKTVVDTHVVCPFCEQAITVTTDERGSFTECGGEGEGSCSGAQVCDADSQTARAHALALKTPVCAACLGGSHCGSEPDFPWRPCEEGEDCGAADHQEMDECEHCYAPLVADERCNCAGAKAEREHEQELRHEHTRDD